MYYFCDELQNESFDADDWRSAEEAGQYLNWLTETFWNSTAGQSCLSLFRVL